LWLRCPGVSFGYSVRRSPDSAISASVRFRGLAVRSSSRYALRYSARSLCRDSPLPPFMEVMRLCESYVNVLTPVESVSPLALSGLRSANATRASDQVNDRSRRLIIIHSPCYPRFPKARDRGHPQHGLEMLLGPGPPARSPAAVERKGLAGGLVGLLHEAAAGGGSGF